MATHIALLRAVNLPGHNKVGMADLRKLLADLGFENVQSILQSGNLIFESTGKTPAQLEGLLESEAKKRLGLETPFFVRSAKDWKAVVAGNPFPEEAERDPGHLIVVFLKKEASAKDVAVLQAAIKGREVVRAKGRHAYIVYPDGVGRSKLTNVMIEKKLGSSGTGRNWNTVLKLGDLVGA
jgi:uncharacterized protein (DUF1697 family)